MANTGTTFVLVHGSFAGGWCWRPVARLIEAKGHRVLAPSLTGLADRSHLIGPSVGLETHVLDIANLIEWEDLDDVVLVGHSYGGMVIGGVAQRLHGRIRSLIFVDAIVPVEGMSILSEATDRLRHTLETMREAGNYRCLPPGYADRGDADAARSPTKLTAHPLQTYLDSSGPTARYDAIASKLFIRARGFSQVAIEQSFRRAAGWGWKTMVLDCGHDIIQEQPNELAGILLAEAEAAHAANAPP